MAFASLAERTAQYIEALKGADWSYEFSDDAEVRRRGAKAMQALVAMQAELDPKHVLWNQYCPPQCVGGGIYA